MPNSIELLETDQNFQNETTTVWFDVDGESYAICFESGPASEPKLLDCDGCPINVERQDQIDIFEALLPLARQETGIEA